MKQLNSTFIHNKLKKRIWLNRAAMGIFFLSTIFCLAVLSVLIYRVISGSIGWLDWEFITNRLSTDPEKAGIIGAVFGTIWMMVVVAPLTFILGVGTAIYLEEYAKKGKLQSFIQMNISNLAGVPSIVFGLLGLTTFARGMNLGNVVLAGGLTMTLMILPIVVVAAQESIRSIPKELREASYGMGATKWQTIKNVILPAAIPGVLTGTILALSRAIGETAPLVVLGIPALLLPIPEGLFDKYTVLPLQIYYWTIDSSLVSEYANLASAAIVVLLIILFLMNSIAIFIRNKFQKRF